MEIWATIGAGVAVVVLGAIILKGLGLRARQNKSHNLLTDKVFLVASIAEELKTEVTDISGKVDNLDRSHAPDPATGRRDWIVRDSLYTDTTEIKKIAVCTRNEQIKTNLLLEQLIRIVEKKGI